jgi:hypothetical protein
MFELQRLSRVLLLLEHPDHYHAFGFTESKYGLVLRIRRKLEAKRLLRSYVDARLEFNNQAIDARQLEKMYTDAGNLHKELWSIATAAAAQDPRSVPTGLFIESLNEVIDLTESRRAAFTNHVPVPIVMMLVLVSFGACGFIGYNRGATGPRNLPATITFIVLSAMVLVIILDVDRPRRGLILVNQDIMVRLQSNLANESVGVQP